MSYKWYIYSLDDNIKISDLKKSNYPTNINTDKIAQYVSDNNINIYCEDANYHHKFLSISSRPYIVYAMGNLDLLDGCILLSIVWPRIPSEYAKQVVTQAIGLLSHKKISIISGLADGIDELAHNESIANNIPTIAVLGGGLSYFLNGNKKNLITKILDSGGLVLSEFRLKQEPTKWSFPQRNRIVAGLSDMVLLPEAGDKSGSLITANFALEMSKPVYIIPNSIYNINSIGSNKLLASNGTYPVWDLKTWVEDNFESKDNIYLSGKKLPDIEKKNILASIAKDNLSSIQQKIFTYISDGADDMQAILDKDNNLDYGVLIGELSMMEIEWYI